MANECPIHDALTSFLNEPDSSFEGAFKTPPVALVEGLEVVGIQHMRSVDGKWHYGEAEYANQDERELVTRSQAEAIIVAERADKKIWMEKAAIEAERVTKLEADNAALTARVKELELQLSVSKETAKIKRVEYLDLDQDHSELKADYAVSEAQLKAVSKALEATHEAISEYYRYQTGGEMRGSYDGKPERNALWKSMYQARAALEARP